MASLSCAATSHVQFHVHHNAEGVTLVTTWGQPIVYMRSRVHAATMWLQAHSLRIIIQPSAHDQTKAGPEQR